jgi:hypothetical protein
MPRQRSLQTLTKVQGSPASVHSRKISSALADAVQRAVGQMSEQLPRVLQQSPCQCLDEQLDALLGEAAPAKLCWAVGGAPVPFSGDLGWAKTIEPPREGPSHSPPLRPKPVHSFHSPVNHLRIPTVQVSGPLSWVDFAPLSPQSTAQLLPCWPERADQPQEPSTLWIPKSRHEHDLGTTDLGEAPLSSREALQAAVDQRCKRWIQQQAQTSLRADWLTVSLSDGRIAVSKWERSAPVAVVTPLHGDDVRPPEIDAWQSTLPRLAAPEINTESQFLWVKWGVLPGDSKHDGDQWPACTRSGIPWARVPPLAFSRFPARLSWATVHTKFDVPQLHPCWSAFSVPSGPSRGWPAAVSPPRPETQAEERQASPTWWQEPAGEVPVLWNTVEQLPCLWCSKAFEVAHPEATRRLERTHRISPAAREAKITPDLWYLTSKGESTALAVVSCAELVAALPRLAVLAALYDRADCVVLIGPSECAALMSGDAAVADVELGKTAVADLGVQVCFCSNNDGDLLPRVLHWAREASPHPEDHFMPPGWLTAPEIGVHLPIVAQWANELGGWESLVAVLADERVRLTRALRSCSSQVQQRRVGLYEALWRWDRERFATLRLGDAQRESQLHDHLASLVHPVPHSAGLSHLAPPPAPFGDGSSTVQSRAPRGARSVSIDAKGLPTLRSLLGYDSVSGQPPQPLLRRSASTFPWALRGPVRMSPDEEAT